LPLAHGRFLFWRAHGAMIQAAGVVLMIAGTCLTPVGVAASPRIAAQDGASAANGQ
jgi:hypothetical protein